MAQHPYRTPIRIDWSAPLDEWVRVAVVVLLNVSLTLLLCELFSTAQQHQIEHQKQIIETQDRTIALHLHTIDMLEQVIRDEQETNVTLQHNQNWLTERACGYGAFSLVTHQRADGLFDEWTCKVTQP